MDRRDSVWGHPRRLASARRTRVRGASLIFAHDEPQPIPVGSSKPLLLALCIFLRIILDKPFIVFGGVMGAEPQRDLDAHPRVGQW